MTQAQHLVDDARHVFATDVDALLDAFGEMWRLIDASKLDAVGRADALRALRQFVLAKFDQRLSLRSTADPVLLQLVNDAHRLLNDDLEKFSWRDDVKDWTRAAKPFVQS